MGRARDTGFDALVVGQRPRRAMALYRHTSPRSGVGKPIGRRWSLADAKCKNASARGGQADRNVVQAR